MVRQDRGKLIRIGVMEAQRPEFTKHVGRVVKVKHCVKNGRNEAKVTRVTDWVPTRLGTVWQVDAGEQKIFGTAWEILRPSGDKHTIVVPRFEFFTGKTVAQFVCANSPFHHLSGNVSEQELTGFALEDGTELEDYLCWTKCGIIKTPAEVREIVPGLSERILRLGKGRAFDMERCVPINEEALGFLPVHTNVRSATQFEVDAHPIAAWSPQEEADKERESCSALAKIVSCMQKAYGPNKYPAMASIYMLLLSLAGRYEKHIGRLSFMNLAGPDPESITLSATIASELLGIDVSQGGESLVIESATVEKLYSAITEIPHLPLFIPMNSDSKRTDREQVLGLMYAWTNVGRCLTEKTKHGPLSDRAPLAVVSRKKYCSDDAILRNYFLTKAGMTRLMVVDFGEHKLTDEDELKEARQSAQKATPALLAAAKWLRGEEGKQAINRWHGYLAEAVPGMYPRVQHTVASFAAAQDALQATTNIPYNEEEFRTFLERVAAENRF